MSRHRQSFVLGTRGSRLALTQTGQVAARLQEMHPGLQVEVKTFTTTGDRMQTEATKPDSATKGIFTKEIEQALLDGEIDVAVHSCKDLAAQLPEGLELAAVPERERVEDILVTESIATLEDWPEDGVVLTGSPRRVCQWKELHPEGGIEPVRGNIETRIRKMRDHAVARGCLLAWAGLRRLAPDLAGIHVLPLDPLEIMPAPGQGALALQTRTDDERAGSFLADLDHSASRLAVEVERHLLIALEAGCSIPLGAWARVEDGELVLSAIYYPAGSEEGIRVEERAPVADGKALATKVAALLKDE
jgi:hydroxymethylbilane synthase